jgi:uncharacterized protein (TIGR02444 family)
VTHSDQAAPARPSPFWRFSLAFYASPGVAPACIDLQDGAKVDVNILLFLLWHATEGCALDAAEVRELEGLIGPWREMTVVPIRNVRRALRTPPPLPASGVAEGYRDRIKQVELEAERLQQEAMYELARAGRFGRPAASPAEAARASIDAYQALLGPFPPDPLEVVLSAFAKLQSSARDTDP